MTLRQAIADAATRLPAASARRDAELLLAHTLQRDRIHVLTYPESELTETQQATFQSLISQRAAHVPLQHLTGHQEFYGLNLRVTPDTLIPRPETELLVETVLDWNPTGLPGRAILDVGTGTGAIAIALAKHLPEDGIVACDLSLAALAVARENAARHNVTHRIQFLHSDLLASVSGRFDIIVSNPPYIPLTDGPTMQPEVVNHEPHTALFAGSDGLEIYRRLIPQAHAALLAGGLLALEFGYGQSEAIQALLTNDPVHPWKNITITNDYSNIPRIATALRPNP